MVTVLGAGIAGATVAGTGAAAGTKVAAVHPIIGALIVIAAGYIDSRYTIPGLTGKKREDGRAPRLLGLPTGANEAGAPRIFAIGRRVRVPTHILWQGEKIRETSNTNRKAGTTTTQRQVIIDALVAVNDRITTSLDQLVGNGTLMIRSSVNLVSVTTDGMSASVVGGKLRVEMGNDSEQDFTDKLSVGDFVYLRGFRNTGASDVNAGFWHVDAVVAHAFNQPSYVDLSPARGQVIAGMVADGGTSASPAVVERVDDKLVDYIPLMSPDPPFFDHVNGTIVIDGTTERQQAIFEIDTRVRFVGYDRVAWDGVSSLGNSTGNEPATGPWRVFRHYTSQRVMFVAETTGSGIPGPGVGAPGFGVRKGPSSNRSYIEFDGGAPSVAQGLFPSGYDPFSNFYHGEDDQPEHPLIAAALGTGNVSAYRGMAFVGLDDFNTSKFGDSLPFQIEALISVDQGMTWQEALTICCERGGVAREFVDTLGVTPTPFEGYFMRGPVAGVANLFPLLLAGQITTQERDGAICFQDTDAADVVQIENGAAFSDLGAFVGSNGEDKVKFTHAAREDLPTSIGIRHQDPDNQYADGYQHFGLRNPEASDYENRQELDLSNLVLTRKQARNLAATYLRRAWINSTSAEFTLPAAYCDVLEGDILTFTDDDGRDFTVRVIQRDIGTNFLVKIVAVMEELDIGVTGSPVQSAAGQVPPTMPQPAQIVAAALDIAPLQDVDAQTPTLYLSAAATPGSNWAGVSVFRSIDNEATWDLVGTIGAEAVIGITLSDIPAFQPAETHGSTAITWQDAALDSGAFGVELENVESQPPLVSYTDHDIVVNRFNWFAVVDPDGATTEVIGVRDVFQISETTYAFSQLLRGLRGTWRAASSVRPAGSRIVGLTEQMFGLSGLKVPFPGQIGPQAVSFRFVPPGRDVADVQSVSLVAEWRNARPFDLRVLDKAIDGTSYDATFSTEHWTRRNLPLGSVGPYPLDESFEEYRFTFYSPNGAAIRRTKTITSRGTGSPTIRDRFVVYTASEQTQDGYTPGPATSFWVDVQQIGDYGASRSVKRLV